VTTLRMPRSVHGLLGRFSVRTKLASSVAVFLLVIGTIMYLSFVSTADDSTRAVVDNIAGRQATLIERYVGEVVLKSEGFRADPASTADRMTQAANSLLTGGKTMAVQSNDNEITIKAATDPVVRLKLIEERTRIGQLVDLGNQVLAADPTTPAYRALVDQLEASSHSVANVAYDAVGRATKDSDAAVHRNSRNQMAIAFGGVLAGVLFSWLVMRSVLGPLSDVVAVYGRMADGDLTTDVEVGTSDELGRMGRGLNQVLGRLRGAMRTLNISATDLTAASGQLSAVSQTLEETAVANASGADRVATTSSAITTTVDGLVAGVANLRSQTAEIGTFARDASTVVVQAEHATTAISTAVSQLGQASAQIGEVVGVITAIAEQTNLLALNATIEAARAGEAGKGFSVVAGEVKDLAQQTARATEDITATIGTIRSRVEEASAASTEIVPIMAAVREHQASIVGAVEQQTATADVMAMAINDLAGSSSAIQFDMAAMAELAAVNASRAQDATQAAGDLATLATTLRFVVDDWTV